MLVMDVVEHIEDCFGLMRSIRENRACFTGRHGYQLLDCFFTLAYQIAPKAPCSVMPVVRSLTMRVASDITSMMLGGARCWS